LKSIIFVEEEKKMTVTMHKHVYAMIHLSTSDIVYLAFSPQCAKGDSLFTCHTIITYILNFQKQQCFVLRSSCNQVFFSCWVSDIFQNEFSIWYLQEEIFDA